MVSIPHRLATNVERKTVVFTGLEFQFLIGWLQTVTTGVYNTNINSFQFLIGWLQTLEKERLTSLQQGRFNSS